MPGVTFWVSSVGSTPSASAFLIVSSASTRTSRREALAQTPAELVRLPTPHGCVTKVLLGLLVLCFGNLDSQAPRGNFTVWS